MSTETAADPRYQVVRTPFGTGSLIIDTWRDGLIIESYAEHRRTDAQSVADRLNGGVTDDLRSAIALLREVAAIEDECSDYGDYSICARRLPETLHTRIAAFIRGMGDDE